MKESLAAPEPCPVCCSAVFGLNTAFHKWKSSIKYVSLHAHKLNVVQFYGMLFQEGRHNHYFSQVAYHDDYKIAWICDLQETRNIK